MQYLQIIMSLTIVNICFGAAEHTVSPFDMLTIVPSASTSHYTAHGHYSYNPDWREFPHWLRYVVIADETQIIPKDLAADLNRRIGANDPTDHDGIHHKAITDVHAKFPTLQFVACVALSESGLTVSYHANGGRSSQLKHCYTYPKVVALRRTKGIDITFDTFYGHLEQEGDETESPDTIAQEDTLAQEECVASHKLIAAAEEEFLQQDDLLMAFKINTDVIAQWLSLDASENLSDQISSVSISAHGCHSFITSMGK